MAEMQKKFVLGVALVSLFGTVTNFVYLSPLLTLLIPLAIFVFNEKTLPKTIFWLYIFLGLFLLSTILYHWRSLIEFGFYRRDGNFIISYSPLFVLPLFYFRYDLNKYIRQFYIFAISLYSIVFVYHLLTIPNFNTVRSWVFGGLFIAQNALGGFLAVLGALGFAFYYNRRGKKELLLFLAVFVMLLASYSRGSILGLILGIIAWYCTITKRFKMLAVIIAIPILCTIGSLAIGYPYFKNVISTHNTVNPQIENVSGKEANILIRVFSSFPRAFYMFTQSPVVGTGVGSYDDRPLRLEGVMPYVSYNATPQKSHTDSHAHHSYLHIMAEQGTIGIIVFLIFWISLFWYLVKIRGNHLMRDFLLIAYFTITFASFTEHRITTPSMMLPFTIPLGMLFFQKNKAQTYVIKKIK